MQSSTGRIVSLSCLVAAASGLGGSPVGKVVQMLSALQQKVIAEGEVSQKNYDEFSEFCSDRNRELGFEVKTGKSQAASLKSAIEKESADIEIFTAKISDLAASISSAEDKLKKATSIRKTESVAFSGVEADLVETIDAIKRASDIIGREMSKGASLTQLGGARGLAAALDALVQASEVRSADATRLTALVQTATDSDDEDEDSEAAAPDASNYNSQSGSIVELLEDLQGKAEEELDKSRKDEAERRHNYEMIKQALSDEIAFSTKDMDEAKKSSAASGERKATSEGEMAVTKQALEEDKKSIEELRHDCMSKASDFEAETVSRGEELKALAAAKKALQEATGASLSQVSLLQVRSSLSAGLRAVHIIRHLGDDQRMPSMERLALRMESFLQSSSAADGSLTSDPFEKVKGLLTNMLDKLESEAAADATHKAFCDKAMAEATAEKAARSTAEDKLSTKIEQATSASTKLREEVVVLQAELAKMANAQAEMDKMRADEKATFEENKAELEKGIEGIRLSLKILRDYYGAPSDSASHETSGGAAGGIVSLIEVCESDYSRSLAEVTTVEEAAQNAYDAETEEMKLSTVAKNKDVSYKTKESMSLDKAVTEMSSDRDRVEETLSAVLESLSSLEKQCIAKADSYAEKKARREQELDGLKSALAALGGDDTGAASLIQSGRRVHVARSGALRGALRAA